MSALTNQTSTSSAYFSAVSSLTSSPTQEIYASSLASLSKVFDDLRRSGTFSTNEEIDDVSTEDIPYLSLPYYLSLCERNVADLDSGSRAEQRRKKLTRGLDLLVAFVGQCEKMRVVEGEEIDGYNRLIYSAAADDDDDGSGERKYAKKMTAGENREAKIARYKMAKSIENEVGRMRGVRDRRRRLGVAKDEDFEGFGDEEVLVREVRVLPSHKITPCSPHAHPMLNPCSPHAHLTPKPQLELKNLKRLVVVSVDEIVSIHQELEMLTMMCEMEKARTHKTQAPPRPTPADMMNNNNNNNANANAPKIPNLQISQDPISGQLIFKREEIRKGVFRPGWNLPTMTLEELGEIEMRDAIEREKRQKEAEVLEKEVSL